MLLGFFDVTPVDLMQLGPEPAVAVLREMILAEVGNLGIPISETDIPYSITTPDGGVDAVVRGTPTRPGNGLIYEPRTSYQVKAGEFPLNASSFGRIEELVIKPSSIERRVKTKAAISGRSYTLDDLSPRIRDCLDHGGTFVTLLFGNDGIDTEEDATQKAIQAFLADIDQKYGAAKVKVWRQSKICLMLRHFPAVSLQIKGIPGLSVLNHTQWSERSDMRLEFIAAQDQQGAIENLREALRNDVRSALHIQVLGEPGIGKTRLVLEATRADDLRPLTLYADKGTKVDGALINALNKAKPARVVLVVDECGPETRYELVQSLSGLAPNLRIVSIYQDRDEGDRASEYRLMEIPRLPSAEIEAILITHGLDRATAKRWAALCEGSPRVAHVIGQNLMNDPDDPLRSDGVARIWVRFLAGDIGSDTEQYRKRHVVLSSLALFKKFGWSAKVRGNAFEVYDLIVSQLDKNISRAEFCAIIDQMAVRKVLQGDHFLYLTPKALHIRLWMDWWNRHGVTLDVNKLIQSLSPKMREWFGEMIQYAGATPVSRKVVEDFLGPDGLYANADWLNTKDGGSFFFSLSQADPRAALRVLERTIGKMDRETLLEFEAGRRDVIAALEGMSVHQDLFRPSAKLLLSLADAENETWSNNATGIFASLFSLGYGEGAPTSLAPEHRLPVLTEALKQDPRRRRIALKAFESALSTHSVTRWGGDPPFLFGEQLIRWSPRTYGELYAAYRLYWRTLHEAIDWLPQGLRSSAVDILLSSARALLAIEDLRNEIIATLNSLGSRPDIDRRAIIETIEGILRYDGEGYPKNVTSQLAAIRDGIIGTSFHSRLQRYAGMDLLEDQIDRNGNKIDRTQIDIQQLAEEALLNRDQLRPELEWLVTDEAKNGYRFGYALGVLDVDRIVWPDIRSAYFSAGDKASDDFVGGYLRSVFDRDHDVLEAIIAEVSESTPRPKQLPALVWRSGMTDGVAGLILQLVKNGRIPPAALGVFSIGRGTDPLSDQMLADWLDALLEIRSFAASATALDLAAMSLHGGKKLTASQMQKIITQPGLFARESSSGRADVMLTHHWLELARRLVQLDPAAEVVVLRYLIEGIGENASITYSLGPEGERFLDQLVARRPLETWEIVSEYVKPPMDMRGFVLTRWLRGDRMFGERNAGPMRHFPRDAIWSWVGPDPEARASYIVSMAPKDFTPETWKGGLIREILCRFGDSDKVQSAVFANFFTGGWWGPASAHYTGQMETLKKLKADEVDPNALRWLTNALISIEQNIEQAEIEEEARCY